MQHLSTDDAKIKACFADPTANLIASLGDVRLTAAALAAHPKTWEMLDARWIGAAAVRHGDLTKLEAETINYTAVAVIAACEAEVTP
jgi:hypothetical protein